MSKKNISWKPVTKGKKKKKANQNEIILQEENNNPNPSINLFSNQMLEEMSNNEGDLSDSSIHSVFVYGVSKMQDKEIKTFFTEQVYNTPK